MVSQVVGPSVVHINTQGAETGVQLLNYRPRGRIPTEGQGSGIIVETSGYILTNWHVVRDATQINVSLPDGDKRLAKLIGHDGATDLAVLKIDGRNLTPANWGDSDKAQPGALVWAVGSPFGLEHTITSGILSAKDRAGLAGTPHQHFLQTDAAVNPGNSGGPLVDAGGQVIGVNTAIVGDSYQGISFAIPSNVAREIYDRIKNEGAIRRGWLGVQLEEMTPDLARQNGLSAPAGVFIASLVPEPSGSPAARAGIQPADILIRWNDAAIIGRTDLQLLVAKTPIGSRAKIAVLRKGQELMLEVVVGERPQHID
jgi:S1-C subfamily serine protease